MKIYKDNERCINCKYFDYIEDSNSDGYVDEINSGFVCGINVGYANLKSFPFKKPMKCYEGED